MPLLDNDKAVKEYFELVKHKYPDMPYEQFREICRSPAQFFKECIKSGRLPRILIKHLGKLRVFQGKLKAELASYNRFLQKGIYDEATYNNNKAWAEYHLKNLQDENTETNKENETGE